MVVRIMSHSSSLHGSDHTIHWNQDSQSLSEDPNMVITLIVVWEYNQVLPFRMEHAIECILLILITVPASVLCLHPD